MVSADAPDLWKCFKEGVLKACDEVCGIKERKERSRGYMVVEQGCKGSDSKKEGCA